MDKFIPPFVALINEEFGHQDHRFWLTGCSVKYPVEESENVVVCKNDFWSRLRADGRLIFELHLARRVMLHGLFNIRTLLLLALCPWVLKKCYWVIWGGDLYQYTRTNLTWPTRLEEAVRRFVIRRVGHLVTYINGDVKLAREWYGAKGVHHECLMYLSNVIDSASFGEPIQKTQKDTLYILVGNSADPSNNHIGAFERLLPYKNENIKIFVPLSYGSESHAGEVVRKGKDWFGEKFEPLMDFMPLHHYLIFLKSVDIAIFNHQRQQAMGNTITLLGMSKTVFMRSDVSHWQFLNGLGIKLNDIANLCLLPLNSDEAKKNTEIVFSYFSKATLLMQLESLFKE
ncbi:TDP-N-acetylfucosamine:lipid II N-acetylfucosaminyltransferase [Cycloclasticus pugetii]|uniref:TDP-N-acetylfucosamine:lipid II N-acetylfucosaminyltransferase n=1 Tax=Cycloclasticus pugetii TaxID=34068 RepID=UPI003A9043BA